MSLFRRLFKYPASIILCAVLFVLLLIVLGDFVEPRIGHSGLEAKFSNLFGMGYLVVLILTSISFVILLIFRKWKSAGRFFIAALTLLVGIFLTDALHPNIYQFAGRAHQEISDIYSRNRSQFDLITPLPRLVDLDQRCHPPGGGAGGCQCWLLLDPMHVSQAEKEKAGWHRPTVPIFLAKDLPIRLIDVRPINSNAFSVLGCDTDWRSWLERLRGF